MMRRIKVMLKKWILGVLGAAVSPVVRAVVRAVSAMGVTGVIGL